jgi:hypothetical protein
MLRRLVWLPGVTSSGMVISPSGPTPLSLGEPVDEDQPSHCQDMLELARMRLCEGLIKVRS